LRYRQRRAPIASDPSPQRYAQTPGSSSSLLKRALESAPKKPIPRLGYWIFEAKKRLPDAKKIFTECHILNLCLVVNIVIRLFSSPTRSGEKTNFGVLCNFAAHLAIGPFGEGHCGFEF
jgi:hypothetical protein